MTKCPRCQRDVPGLGRYCEPCGAYTADPLDLMLPGKNAADPRLEKEIQASCINVWRSMGFRCWSLSQPRASMQTEGIADYFVTGRGLCIWCESKRPGEKQSDNQRDFETDVTSNGGIYVVITNEADIPELVDRLLSR